MTESTYQDLEKLKSYKKYNFICSVSLSGLSLLYSTSNRNSIQDYCFYSAFPLFALYAYTYHQVNKESRKPVKDQNSYKYDDEHFQAYATKNLEHSISNARLNRRIIVMNVTAMKREYQHVLNLRGINLPQAQQFLAENLERIKSLLTESIELIEESLKRYDKLLAEVNANEEGNSFDVRQLDFEIQELKDAHSDYNRKLESIAKELIELNISNSNNNIANSCDARAVRTTMRP